MDAEIKWKKKSDISKKNEYIPKYNLRPSYSINISFLFYQKNKDTFF